MDEPLSELVRDFGFTWDETRILKTAIALAGACLRAKDRRRTTRAQERDAKRSLRADPTDKEARDTLRRIQCRRQPLVVEGGELVGVSTAKVPTRKDQTDHQLHAATAVLANFWKKFRGPIPLYDGAGKEPSWRPDTPGMRPSAGIEFISRALRIGGAHPLRCEPTAVRRRLTAHRKT
jgi:hypothetical protein